MGVILFDILEEWPYSRVIIKPLTAEDLQWYLVELDMDKYFEHFIEASDDW